MRTLTARYAGTCIRCGEDIDPGQQIHYQRGLGAAHVECPAPPDPEAFQTAREAKADRAQGYAANAQRRSEGLWQAAHREADMIPLGQPILVGHHSERGHRRALERIQGRYERSMDEQRKADYWARKAANATEDRAISSMDPEAADKLRAKIAQLEEILERDKRINKAYRQGKLASLGLKPEAVERIEATMRQCPWLRTPMLTTHTAANIRRYRERLAEIEKVRS